MKKILVFVGMLVMSAYGFAQGIEGDAENGQLRSAIAVHTSEMRVCYRDNQKAIKGAQGKVFYEFEVNVKGELLKVDFNSKKAH